MSVPAKSQAATDADAGRAALAGGSWEEARALFEASVSAEETPEGLEGLGWAAWWLDDEPLVFDARERAFRLYRKRGDREAAARIAGWLATDHADFHGDLAVAQGWLARARRLLEGLAPGPEHGWLYVHEAEKLIYANDTRAARELGARAAELGRRLDLLDLETMGLATEGLALVTDGEVAEGVARMDEAAAAALGGELEDLFPAAWCCCYTMLACDRLRDYDRAAQWARRFEDWSERTRVPFANRLCRTTRAGVLLARGMWKEAEPELIECAAILGEIRPPMAAEATVRLGELRRRQGRLEEAAEIFEQVAGHPQALLGLGEICLDRGDAAGARDQAEQYLRETPPAARALRVPALELLVRAHAALGQGERAAAALAELDVIADMMGGDPLRALAAFGAGVVAATSGESERARAAFQDAVRLFQRTGAPFEVAQVRLELAATLHACGRDDAAAREAEAALRVLRELGATKAISRAEALLGGLGQTALAPKVLEGPLGGLTKRELEVLALVAEGLSNQRIAEQLVISEHTVKRHVANVLQRLELPSRTAAASLAARHGLRRLPQAR